MKPLATKPRATIDESADSEITIYPDGRVFAFGITRSLALVLGTMPMADSRMKRLLERIGNLPNEQPAEPDRPYAQETE